MGDRGELQFFPAAFLTKSHRGKDRGIKSGEGAGELIILNRLEDIGGVEGKEEADRRGSIRGHGTEEEGEIEPRPRPRLPGKILNGHNDGQGRRNRRSRHRRQEEAGSGDQGGGQK